MHKIQPIRGSQWEEDNLRQNRNQNHRQPVLNVAEQPKAEFALPAVKMSKIVPVVQPAVPRRVNKQEAWVNPLLPCKKLRMEAGWKENILST